MSKKRKKQMQKAQNKVILEEASSAKRSIWNWLCLLGSAAAVFYLMHDAIGISVYPGYNWMSQAVSDLTALDAPSYSISSMLSTAYGVCMCICCCAMCVLVTPLSKLFRSGVYAFGIMNVVSALGYSLFPLSSAGFDGSFQSVMHIVVTVLVVLLSIASLVLIIIGSFKSESRFIGGLAVVALSVMVLGAIGTGLAPDSVFGLFERFSTYSTVVFGAILSMFFFVNTQAMIKATQL